MLIEYKIKFEKDGVTITQSIDAGSAASEAAPDNPVVQNLLQATAKESEAANAEAAPPAAGPNDRPKPGGPNDRSKGGGPNDRDKGGGPNDRDKGGAADGESLPMTIIGPFIWMSPPPNEPAAEPANGDPKKPR